MTIAHIFSEAVIQALGWTVVHSLWQAALLASLAGIGMLMMHHRPARERYLLSVSALAGILVWSVCTFFSHYHPLPEPSPMTFDSAGPVMVSSSVQVSASWTAGITEQFSTYFSNNAPLIATCWMLGMTFFLLKMLGALLYANQLKRRRVNPLSEKWQQALQTIARRIGVKRAVRLLESAAIKTPMTIGFLKPVILLPLGMVNNLSPEQVEAVLAHELAHIHRSDFLVNIFQTIVETLYYFNPAVWWLSAAVRAEREDCCDDIAVRNCKNSLDYAKALVSVQEWGQSRTPFALAFAGNKNRLLNRVRRILNHPQNKSNIMEKFAATCLLLLAVLALTVSAAYPGQHSKEDSSALNAAMGSDDLSLSAIDSLPRGNARINLEKNGKSLEAKVKDGVITYLKVDGKEIPKEEFSNYESMVEEAFGEAPMPPMPPFPPSAPAPPSPLNAPNAPTPTNPPSPPNAPSPPSPVIGLWEKSSKITREQDANGNTIIRIEKMEGDEPFVFEWKEGDPVFKLNGEPFEEGHLFANPELFAGKHLELLRKGELSKQMREGMREDALRLAEEMKGMSEKQKEEMKLRLKEWKETEQMRLKELEEQRLLFNRSSKDFLEFAPPVLDGNIWGYFEDGGRVDRTVESALEKALVKDGLIPNTQNYTLELTGKGMKVNGKKQPDAIWEKYKAIYRKVSGFELNGKSKIVVDKDNAQ